MKFCWFHLMPYTKLPEDFREKYPSVYIDIPRDLFDPAAANVMYNDFMDELEFADQQGFDAICVNEHHSNGYGMMPSPNLIAATLARRTTNAAICIMGNSLALYNPPTRVAEEMAMIDCISGGRLIAGFPVGTPFDTCYAYSQNPSQLRDRYREAHDLIVRAWSDEDVFSFNGRFNQQRYVNIWLKPVQRPRPPIWIPGGGSIETWQWCAEKDYVYANLSYFGFEAARSSLEGFWRDIDRVGKDRNPYRAGFLQFVGVAETRAEAMKLYKEPAEYFFHRSFHIDPRYGNPPGYVTEGTIRAKMVSQLPGRRGGGPQAGPADTFEEMVERGHVIVGSPDEVADKLKHVVTQLNIGHLMMLMQFGNMPKDLVTENTRLFAQKVAPQLRHLFDDKWEDHWWPKPLPRPARATPAQTTLRAAE